ncbi:MAG: aminomethyl-transferring glycine dehydrogenase [Bacteroidales bacterium]|nr:aminomethyl-transferring glycine dehydrogenase [Bacteroidales bacterium]
MLNDNFTKRHIGPNSDQMNEMLKEIGLSSIEELVERTIPDAIKLPKELNLDKAKSEFEILNKLTKLGEKNLLFRTFIGLGYYGTMMPSVIQRNVLENPVWYTSYTPYQAEISQGRLEALLNFQTAIAELTGMDVANASLLDESTAAAEAMRMFFDNRSNAKKKADANQFFVDENIFPQTKSVLIARAEPLGIEVIFGSYENCNINEKTFAALVQYPNVNGEILDYKTFVENAHSNDCQVVVAADILSLALLTPPGEWGADVVVGSSQRLGLPMGYGGPHAGYFATSQKYIRKMPGRIIGVSRDKNGKVAYRMTLQTREQHIKREKATSNICTAQALLASLSGFYAIYHGYEGLKNIATSVHLKTIILSERIKELGLTQMNKNFFDTIKIEIEKGDKEILETIAYDHEINFRICKDFLTISLDETTSVKDLNKILKVLAKFKGKKIDKNKKIEVVSILEEKFVRTSKFMQQDVFKKYRSETEMMRYIKKLERKDISLAHSMIPLGSCTMKLNSAVSMLSLSNGQFANIHPFVPKWQAKGYQNIIKGLKKDLVEITGMDDLSFQPNSGASGEHAGLMVIRAYQNDIGQGHRNICLIPASAHGTNPASAIMAGYNVIVVKSDEKGNIDVADLEAKAIEHKDNLAAFMVTYPSTHGVFEKSIIRMCEIIHENGGQVYMDGANMNAQIGFTNPGFIGADVCHLNLHKTFAIPHGGGGPGVGPIAVKKHLSPFLPTHPIIRVNKNEKAIDSLSGAPYGSAMILPISYAYIKMLGAKGLKKSTIGAILNANYIAAKLKDYFPILYTAETGRVAHELILDLRNLKHEIDVAETDVSKRLMDFGYHAPTVSFPVHGTLMVEPTESESKEELDKFIEAMIIIHGEIEEIRSGKADKNDNVLKNAPHPEYEIVANEWKHSYSREKAAYPAEWVRENKFWINVARIDDAFGDRKTFCSIVTPEFEEQIKNL